MKLGFAAALFCAILFFASFVATEKNPLLDKSDLVELGHRLFFEKKLSQNSTKSCATCHAPELAFTDGYRRSLGLEADVAQRNSPTLLNIAHYKMYNWANFEVISIAQQSSQPLFRQHPPELGLVPSDTSKILLFLQKSDVYTDVLKKQKIVWSDLTAALEAYINSLESRNSAYDRFHRDGDTAAMDSAAQRGEQLFFGQKLKCGICHPAPDFTLATTAQSPFFNIGLYEKYPLDDEGLFERTGKKSDKGKFRTPTLRNVALTAPYMHDGSVADLSKTLDIFASGGSEHRNKSQLIRPFSLSAAERSDVLAFLFCLTDTSYLQNSHFLAPH